MAHSHTARRRVRQAWAKENVRRGQRQREVAGKKDVLVISAARAEVLEALQGIMRQLQNGPVSLFDVALEQQIREANASKLLRSLEAAGITEAEKVRRIKRRLPHDVSTKRWRLTEAYRNGLVAFEPHRIAVGGARA